MITVKKENANLFVNDLILKIEEIGFGSMSKADIYDYLLYLLDKYSAEHFLETKSNFENARFLKITEKKLKNSKLNIDLKFKDNDRDKVIAEFLSKVSSKNFKLSSKDENKYVFVLDNVYTRMCIESFLKENGETLGHENNSEQVVISKTMLYELLNKYQIYIETDLKKNEFKNSLEKLIKKFGEKYIPVTEIINVISNFPIKF